MRARHGIWECYNQLGSFTGHAVCGHRTGALRRGGGGGGGSALSCQVRVGWSSSPLFGIPPVIRILHGFLCNVTLLVLGIYQIFVFCDIDVYLLYC